MRDLFDEMVALTGYRPTLLVVDDDPVTVAVLHAIFASKVNIVTSSEHAAAFEHCNKLRPDLILLDKDLGPGNGFALCQQIKQCAALAATPVIFLTASQTEDDEVRAFQLGAVDFIRKPISAYIVESRVLTHLALRLQTILLKRLAHSDGLTGLKNRRAFDKGLERAWRECARSGAPLSVILMDVDNFKQYNDQYGHLEGDACLRQLASVVQAALCRPADYAARYGGEEFACVLPHTDHQGALAVAQGIRARVAAQAIPHCRGATAAQVVTVSLGVASCIPAAAHGWLELVGQADTQLYQAKQMGRNRVCGHQYQQRQSGGALLEF
jgi:diguanylate cyclase (GGDEF)-like protein